MAKMFNAAMIVAALVVPQAAFAQAAAPAAAPVASAPGYPAIADFGAAIRSSKAYQAAATQVQAQYKPQIDAYNTQSAPLQAELQRMADELRSLQQSGAADTVLNPKIQAFQARQQAIQTQLAPASASFDRPLAYAEEQITAKLDQATRNAMTAKRVTILLRTEAIAFAMPTANITGDIIQQLNALVPTVSIAVPANWQPGGQQGGAAATGARPATTGGKPTTGAKPATGR